MFKILKIDGWFLCTRYNSYLQQIFDLGNSIFYYYVNKITWLCNTLCNIIFIILLLFYHHSVYFAISDSINKIFQITTNVTW